MLTNKANNGQRRNYRQPMAVTGNPKAVHVDCPACRLGGAVVLPGQATAECFNCGATIRMSWQKTDATKSQGADSMNSEIADKITSELFESSYGVDATRLVQVIESSGARQRELGGWSKAAVRDVVKRELEFATKKAVGQIRNCDELLRLDADRAENLLRALESDEKSELNRYTVIAILKEFIALARAGSGAMTMPKEQTKTRRVTLESVKFSIPRDADEDDEVLVSCEPFRDNGRWEVVGEFSVLTPAEKRLAKKILSALLATAEERMR